MKNSQARNVMAKYLMRYRRNPSNILQSYLDGMLTGLMYVGEISCKQYNDIPISVNRIMLDTLSSSAEAFDRIAAKQSIIDMVFS